MSDWKGHLIFGTIFVTAFLIINWYFKLLTMNLNETIFFYVPLILFFMLVPDIDHDSSKPRWIITIIMVILAIYNLAVGRTVLAVVILFIILGLMCLKYMKGFEHRGHVHSVLFLLILCLATFAVVQNWTLILILFIAGISHLVIDQFTGRVATLKWW